MRIPVPGRRTSRVAKLALFAIGASLLAACTDLANHNPTGDDAAPGLLPGKVVTVQGNDAASLYLPIFIIAVAIFFLIEGLLLYMSWRFRRRSSGDDLPPQTHGNNRLEVIWTVIPAIIVTGMFIASTMVLSNVQAESDKPAVEVDVQAFRFGWKFDYPDYGITVAGGGAEGAPQMVLPVGEPIRFHVTSVDVIHSFYVPSFFFKRDAIPGRVNTFDINIEEPGTYGGQCAEFCGINHSQMFFSVRAVAPDKFDAWVAEQTGGSASAAPTTGGAN